jgi:hypothetical protein
MQFSFPTSTLRFLKIQSNSTTRTCLGLSKLPVQAAGRFCRELADCLSAIGSVKPLRLSLLKASDSGQPKTVNMKGPIKSLERNGFTLPWREFQPIPGKIFQQRISKQDGGSVSL